MKRFVLLLIAAVTVTFFACERKVEFLKNEPPEIPLSFRANTIIKNKDGQFTVMTDAASDGIVEFLITEHETLKGIVFRSTPVSLEITSGTITVTANKEELPDSAVFSVLGNALREIHQTVSEPVLKDGVYEYSYESFLMKQDSVSGKIVSMEFPGIGYIIEFI